MNIEPLASPESDDGKVSSESQVVEASEGTLTLLDHHLRFQRTGSERVVDMAASEIRRVQLDIEAGRPATVAIVPNAASMEAQVLTVERDQFDVLVAAILHLAVDLDDVSGR
jgi:hypothetical protein